MNAQAAVKIGNTVVALGNRVIHFYYSLEERRRLVSVLAEALENGEGIVFACTHTSASALRDDLHRLRLSPNREHFLQLLITEDLAGSIEAIVAAAKQVRSKTRGIRVLLDFGQHGNRMALNCHEAVVTSAFFGMDVPVITQYDGRDVPTHTILEQFSTHDLTLVSNVLYHENPGFQAQPPWAAAAPLRRSATV